jgi:hypothetical protein
MCETNCCVCETNCCVNNWSHTFHVKAIVTFIAQHQQCEFGDQPKELMLCGKCDNGFHMKCGRSIVVSTIGLTHFMWNPLSHLSHNISNVRSVTNRRSFYCAINVAMIFTWNVWDQLLCQQLISHISCENHCHIYRTITAPSVGHRSHVAHNDVNVHHHHHIPYPRHYIRHQRLLLKPQRLLQVVCRMVDEADELHRRRRSMRSLEPLNRKIWEDLNARIENLEKNVFEELSLYEYIYNICYCDQ